MFQKVNIEDKLLHLESKNRPLDWVSDLLSDELHTNRFTSVNKLFIDNLKKDRVYHINTIRIICINYRLRFVDLKFYKGKLPPQTHLEIETIEKENKTQLHSFKILASLEVLNLKNYDDPILFVPIGNNYYYKIYRWGNDMNFFRKVIVFPMRSLETLLFSILILSLLTTFLLASIETELYIKNSFFLISLLFVFKSYIAIVLYYCIWKGKNLSSLNWNSFYFNH